MNPTVAARRRRRSSTGQAMVEMALILPLMCLLLFAILDFGWAMFTYLGLNLGLREGVRVASMNVPRSMSSSDYTDFIKGVIVDSAFATGLVSSEITVTVGAVPAGDTQPRVTITVDHTHNFFGPYIQGGMNLNCSMSAGIITWTSNTAANFSSG